MAAWSGRLFGLNVESELALPFAPDLAPDAEQDSVHVCFGEVTPVDDSLTRQGEDGLQLQIEEVGRFLITSGREIIIDPAVGVSDRNLRVYLLGSAFGAILHQRGILALHANAVVIAGKAIAFIGRSGAGKSTLAAWFQAQGHVVLADDVCAICFDSDGQPFVLPGVPRLRLWKDALEHAGYDSGSFERSFDGADKYDVPAPRHVAQEAMPLGGCYWLDEPETDAPLAIETLKGARAVEMLMTNTYRGQYVSMLGRSASHVQTCVQLTATVPVYRASRRKCRDEYDGVAMAMLRHALEALRSGMSNSPSVPPRHAAD